MAPSFEDINQSLGVEMITFNPFPLERLVVHSDRLTPMPSVDLPLLPTRTQLAPLSEGSYGILST